VERVRMREIKEEEERKGQIVLKKREEREKEVERVRMREINVVKTS
jgi:hypothetical protein